MLQFPNLKTLLRSIEASRDCLVSATPFEVALWILVRDSPNYTASGGGPLVRIVGSHRLILDVRLKPIGVCDLIFADDVAFTKVRISESSTSLMV